jgi:hypothetical protein
MDQVSAAAVHAEVATATNQLFAHAEQEITRALAATTSARERIKRIREQSSDGANKKMRTESASQVAAEARQIMARALTACSDARAAEMDECLFFDEKRLTAEKELLDVEKEWLELTRPVRLKNIATVVAATNAARAAGNAAASR